MKIDKKLLKKLILKASKENKRAKDFYGENWEESWKETGCICLHYGASTRLYDMLGCPVHNPNIERYYKFMLTKWGTIDEMRKAGL